MKARLFILCAFVFATLSIPADDFVDDVYYLSQVDLQTKLKSSETPLTPYYSKIVKEIVFIDTTDTQYPDTVRAIIRYNQE